MAYENSAGLNVHNHYGPRVSGGSAGVERTTDSLNTLSVQLSGASLNQGFISTLTVPEKAKFLRAYLTVDEPITGATTVDIGEGDDPAVNGIRLTAANLGTVGVVDVTEGLRGTWDPDSATTRASKIGVAFAGTPAEGGSVSLVVEYIFKTRDDTNWQPDPDTLVI